MRFLIEILIKHHVFITFMFIAIFCLSLIMKINPYNEAKILNGARNLMYASLGMENSITEYFRLKKMNIKLEDENCSLIEENELLKFENDELSLYKKYYNLIFQSEDTRFNYIPAKVEKKNWTLSNNILILNKGKKHGVKKNMGVFNKNGVVGFVSNVTSHFCEVTTLISQSTKLLTSIKTKQGILDEGLLKWDGNSYKHATIEGVGNEINISKGDSIFTCSDSKSFYSGIFIGTISEFEKKTSSNSFKINVSLGVDFKNINSAIIIKDNLKSELNSFYENK